MKCDVKFNYKELKQLIVDKFPGKTFMTSLNRCGQKSSINPYRMDLVLNNKSYFSNREIIKIINTLSISLNDINKYFFNVA